MRREHLQLDRQGLSILPKERNSQRDQHRSLVLLARGGWRVLGGSDS